MTCKAAQFPYFEVVAKLQAKLSKPDTPWHLLIFYNKL